MNLFKPIILRYNIYRNQVECNIKIVYLKIYFVTFPEELSSRRLNNSVLFYKIISRGTGMRNIMFQLFAL